MNESAQSSGSYGAFYRKLFAPLEEMIGSIDPETIFAVMGFDAGGPLNFNTIGARGGKQFVTYVSCELAVRAEQRPSEFGHYELLASCDNEQWVRHYISEIGRMSLTEAFGHGHTLDFGECVEESAPLQGVIFEKMFSIEIDDSSYGIMRCIGVSRPEMAHARERGSASLFELLKQAHVYPHTDTRRSSVV
jgi:hypothetical protein